MSVDSNTLIAISVCVAAVLFLLYLFGVGGNGGRYGDTAVTLLISPLMLTVPALGMWMTMLLAGNFGATHIGFWDTFPAGGLLLTIIIAGD